MNSTRLAVIGFIIAVIVAVYAFITQQQAVDNARLAAFQATTAEDGRVTAVAMMQEAVGTQVQAEAGQATARADSEIASTAQSEAEDAAATAEAQANQAATRSAQIIASSTAGSEALQSTSVADANNLSTSQAQSTAALATVQAELEAQVTLQADTASQLATATSQVDLADFAREAAEADRARALEQLWDIGTQQAETRDELATAQAIVSGATPTHVPTDPPPPSATPQTAATAVTNSSELPPLTNEIETNNGLMRVQYPRGWFARETDIDFITITNDEALFERGNGALESGQYEIDILAATKAELGIDPTATTEEVLLNFVEFFRSRDSAFEAGEPFSVTLGRHEGSRALGSDGSNDLAITLLYAGDEGVALVFGYGAVGEGNQFAELMDAVLATVDFG